jgi:hypothetical protein
VTLDAFIAASETRGFEVCLNADNEPGFEKVVLYAKGGVPTHAARQLLNGNWTSKLGREIDVQHNTPEALVDEIAQLDYGRPITYFAAAAAGVKKPESTAPSRCKSRVDTSGNGVTSDYEMVRSRSRQNQSPKLKVRCKMGRSQISQPTGDSVCPDCARALGLWQKFQTDPPAASD